ncbi:MAG: sigma-70 family RNA polymerase sigma factor [Verrucomicrobia bacterium]|jgi:RNA polymerase sigma-70 factor (ECF subfamily)|nr:sigma-70 family RNA polymerase sigma factor [Verrucomicrobiota bacterium]|tara:strand:- start:11802 stop:12353 length:552 start_codon:yes stop_codon:yes gene_type:complete
MQAVEKILNMKNQTDHGMDRKSFSILVKEHHRGLLAYARALTKEDHTSRDIVQDAFVVAWRNLETFDITRDFGSWMRGIVRNKWRESLRKNARETALDDETLEYLEADAKQWDGLRDQGGVFTRLELCLKKLPENLADAVKAFYYDGYNGAEAATVLNVQSATLRKRLERARGGLRDCLAANS